MWRPVYDDGETVRFFNDVEELIPLDPEWARHVTPTSSTVRSGHDLEFRLDLVPVAVDGRPTGPRRAQRWAVGALRDGHPGSVRPDGGFGAPPGHGHDYQLEWPGAWAQVIPPDGWTSEDTEAIEHLPAPMSGCGGRRIAASGGRGLIRGRLHRPRWRLAAEPSPNSLLATRCVRKRSGVRRDRRRVRGLQRRARASSPATVTSRPTSPSP